MLQKEPLDLIQITNENNAACPVVEAAAAQKIPVMLEKPLASTLADDIAQACEVLAKKGSLHPHDRKRVKTGTGY